MFLSQFCPPTHTPPRARTAGSGSSLPPTHRCTASRHSSVPHTHRLLHDSSRRLRFEQTFFPCIVTNTTTTFQLFTLFPLPIATPAAVQLDPARLSYHAVLLLQSTPVGWSLETFRSCVATYTPLPSRANCLPRCSKSQSLSRPCHAAISTDARKIQGPVLTYSEHRA